MSDAASLFRPRLKLRRRLGWVFALACLLLCLFAMASLAVLLVRVAREGWSHLDWSFIQSFPSYLDPQSAGIKSALLGTAWLVGLTLLFAVPVGVGAGIYLEEYASKNRLVRLISLNINNLAGVPSIVYGILGLAVFVRWFHFGRSVLAGALTLSLLILPVVIIASREALRAVPRSYRLASFALGATTWMTIRHHVLPAALPGIMTGVILSISRAIGEAAPLIVVGALTYVAFMPEGPLDDFTALPIQIYNWSDQPDQVFHELAAAGIVVLLVVLFSLNLLAVGIRSWQQSKRA